MQSIQLWRTCFLICVVSLALSACATQHSDQTVPAQMSEEDSQLPLYHGRAPFTSAFDESRYASVLPQSIDIKKKVVIVDPKVFAWGAYENGKLIRAGIASAGANYCPDDGGPCRTKIGIFHIFSVGSADCVSKTYPRPEGGALMPYCMFFHDGESLHGSPDPMLVQANISHGCIHMRIPDAEWLRYNFVNIGTEVIIKPY